MEEVSLHGTPVNGPSMLKPRPFPWDLPQHEKKFRYREFTLSPRLLLFQRGLSRPLEDVYD